MDRVVAASSSDTTWGLSVRCYNGYAQTHKFMAKIFRVLGEAHAEMYSKCKLKKLGGTALILYPKLGTALILYPTLLNSYCVVAKH